jgi:hypothetical protein
MPRGERLRPPAARALMRKMRAREPRNGWLGDARSVRAAKFASQAGREPDGRLDLGAPH